MGNFEDGKKVWRALSEREAARRKNLRDLRAFMETLSGKKKTPKSLLKLVVYTGGLRASEAADILGVKRQAIDLFMRYLMKRGLVDVESLKHPNPTMKPTHSVLKKMKKAYKKERARESEGAAPEISTPAEPSDEDIDRAITDLDLTLDLEPTMEPEPAIPQPEPDLIPGATYLVLEERDERSITIFKKEVEAGHEGLFVSRVNPKIIRKKHDCEGCKFIWLTSVQTPAEIETVSGVQDLSILVGNFLDTKPDCVILLDGLEYLISNNNFPLVLKLVQQLRDKVSTTESKLIIPVNPGALTDRQLPLLDVECEVMR